MSSRHSSLKEFHMCAFGYDWMLRLHYSNDVFCVTSIRDTFATVAHQIITIATFFLTVHFCCSLRHQNSLWKSKRWELLDFQSSLVT